MKLVRDRKLKLIEEVELQLYEEDGKYYVDAEVLHEWLGVKTAFSKWFKRRVDSYKFIEYEDYLVYYYKDFNKLTKVKSDFSQTIENTKVINCSNLKKLSDFTNEKQATAGLGYNKKYFLSKDMTKHLAMVEDADKGKLVRDYYIALENYISETRQRELFKEWRKEDCEHRRELHDLIGDNRDCMRLSIAMNNITSYIKDLPYIYKKEEFYKRYIKGEDKESWILYLDIQDAVINFIKTFMAKGVLDPVGETIDLLKEVYIGNENNYRRYTRTHKTYK